MRNFFRQLQEVHNPPEIREQAREELPPNYPQLRKQYVHFCQSRDRSEGEIVHDLHELIHMPEIAAVAFVQHEGGLECLLGTINVVITNPATGRMHDIGEFIVRINRGGHGILFENITRGIPCYENGAPKGRYHHPHIYANGQMCMSAGKTLLQEYIGKGMIYDAARIIVRALWTLDAVPIGHASIEKWPLLKEE
jgi:hypothetical protein